MLVGDFARQGKVDVILGGQYGSEGKGAASAYLFKRLTEEAKSYDLAVTNAGVQSGHTSIHQGKKRVLFHLPTYGVLAHCPIYLDAGSVIDPDVLLQEMEENDVHRNQVEIHPNAAIITQECRDAEMNPNSAQTKIAGTRKGVGEAIARKVLRSGVVARDCPQLEKFVSRHNLSSHLALGRTMLLEVPQGISLSLNGPFYPYCTSRDCTVAQAMSDADIHPAFIGSTILVMRTFPIRVGNIVDVNVIGYSGYCWSDQREISWEKLGVTPEITTVTKRQRRVFTWSLKQLCVAMSSARPHTVYLTFCDYLENVDPPFGKLEDYQDDIRRAAQGAGVPLPQIVCQFGPSTDDVGERRKP